VKVGVPCEIKDNEYRAGMVPSSVFELAHLGHEVLIQSGLGDGINLSDDDYRAAGAAVVLGGSPVPVPALPGGAGASGRGVKVSCPAKVVLLTECSMSDNVAAEAPDTDFVRPCNLCPHMKRITLANIRDALMTGETEIEIDEDVRLRAKAAIDAMLALPKTDKPLDFDVKAKSAPVDMIH